MTAIPSTFEGLTGQIITLLQLLVAATSHGAETNPKTRCQYSKFSRWKKEDDPATWPSKVAMMVIYTPALIVAATLLILGRHGVDQLGGVVIPLPSLAAVFCTIHFAKRCLEVLFLHKYSGRTDRGTPIQISTYYTLLSILIAYGAGRSNHDHDGNFTMMAIGTFLFATGILGNFYHHYLLATLRTSNQSSDNKKYIAPKGGLFTYVATPHYLFELIGWLGIAVVSHHLNVYLVFVGMSSYLSGRSVAQNDFNRRKFGEESWPESRKNLIPFVF